MKTKITFFSMALLIAFLLLGCSSNDENSHAGSSSTIPQAPSGAKTQYLPVGSTVSDINVQGNGIKWYSKKRGLVPTLFLEENQSPLFEFMTFLPPDTAVRSSSTYYASQTINNIESRSFLAVKVFCYER